MSGIEVKESFECEKNANNSHKILEIPEKSRNGFWANGYSIHWNWLQWSVNVILKNSVSFKSQVSSI